MKTVLFMRKSPIVEGFKVHEYDYNIIQKLIRRDLIDEAVRHAELTGKTILYQEIVIA
jgi:hypothetical protein